MVGAAASFRASAAGGNGAITYQWTKNGAPIAGAIAASYTTPPSVEADGGSTFQLEARDGNGTTITSISATLLVLKPSAQTFYISPTRGNDSWSGRLADPNGTGTDGPFRTLGRAQTAMRLSSTMKTATLRAGTYSIQATHWTLDAQDSDETWIASPCEAAVIDGGGTGYIYAAGTNNLTFQSLTFQNLGAISLPDDNNRSMRLTGSGFKILWNTFIDCKGSCIGGPSFTNSVIDSNSFDNHNSPMVHLVTRSCFGMAAGTTVFRTI